MARTMVNDTDSSNPFHTDANLLLFVDDWGVDLAAYLGWPRAQQTITFAQGDGPNSGAITNAKNLNQDIVEILSVYFENITTGLANRLKPRTEHEMQAYNPQWRYPSGQALPTYYILLDGPTEGTVDWPQSQVTVNLPCNEVRTMRIHYIQAPAASSITTNSPIFPPNYHKSAVYYLASMMMLPKDPRQADYYFKLYDLERKRQKSLTSNFRDDAIEIWDHVNLWDQAIAYKS